MRNPFKLLNKKDIILWIVSMALVAASNIFAGKISPLYLITPLIGVTALIFTAKGNVWGQILIAIFSILYGIISFQFRYWGEMATYVGMSMPMALWAIYTWIKNPSKENHAEVAIQKLSVKQKIAVGTSGIAVTCGFFFLLKFLETPNLVFSVLSVTTSFYAAALTMLRSSYYAFWYAINDLILIILWTFASISNPVYIPVVVNFAVFLINDAYGFYSWKKRE